jgi:hypothetical protein
MSSTFRAFAPLGFLFLLTAESSKAKCKDAKN